MRSINFYTMFLIHHSTRLTSYLVILNFSLLKCLYLLFFLTKKKIFLSYVSLIESKLEKESWGTDNGRWNTFVFECMPINFTTTCNRAFHGRKIHSNGGCRPGVGGFGLQIRLVSYLAVLRNELRWGGSRYGSIMQMHKHIICLCRWGEILVCEGS